MAVLAVMFKQELLCMNPNYEKQDKVLSKCYKYQYNTVLGHHLSLDNHTYWHKLAQFWRYLGVLLFLPDYLSPLPATYLAIL